MFYSCCLPDLCELGSVWKSTFCLNHVRTSVPPHFHRAETSWQLVTVSAIKAFQQVSKIKYGQIPTSNIWKSEPKYEVILNACSLVAVTGTSSFLGMIYSVCMNLSLSFQRFTQAFLTVKICVYYYGDSSCHFAWAWNHFGGSSALFVQQFVSDVIKYKKREHTTRA